MKIRAITYFCNPGYPIRENVMRSGAEFLVRARHAYEAAGYEVQTTRLATIPFPKLLGEKHVADLPRVAQELEQLLEQLGVGYLSLGPAGPQMPQSYEVIPEAIAATENTFFGGVMADRRHGIDMAAVRRCAGIIVQCAPIDPNGFANLRFAALANVRAEAPFFPAAYHEGSGAAFGVATEAADLAVAAFGDARNVGEGRRALVALIEKHAKAITRAGKDLGHARRSKPRTRSASGRAPRFLGIDFSLAPFPTEAASIGSAFERMGVPKAGLHGSLAAAAILTEAIHAARFQRVGFSGLMLPVLEDATLAARAAQGVLTVKDLLLYSAVCGTGLDTVPLPGDATAAQITALLLDVAALALRLDKPLTARLMPVPGKKAGDPTGFDFAFFANSKVMALESEGLHGPLGASDSFPLRAR